jgi:predicted transcriptional regulator
VQEKRSIQESVNLIYSTVCRSEKPLSQLEICRAIERKKTPWLIGVITRLADEGWLTRSTGRAANGREVFVYSVGRKC